jgi:hypothetical protein
MKDMPDPAAPDSPCPDFDLANLIELDPAMLVPAQDDDADAIALKELTLQLALAFNDFKLLSWTQEQLSKGKPKQDIVSPYVGQWVGMSLGLAPMPIG